MNSGEIMIDLHSQSWPQSLQSAMPDPDPPMGDDPPPEEDDTEETDTET